MHHPIYLSGFMGVGKSTIGIKLAKKLHLPFLDTDTLIETKTKKSISQIFKKNGEAFFRKKETEVLIEIQKLKPCVVGLGGGAVLSFENRKLIKRGIWINLNASFSIIAKRVLKSKNRPLIKSKMTRDSLNTLYKKRRPYYQLAPFQIWTDGKSVDGVVKLILSVMNKKP